MMKSSPNKPSIMLAILKRPIYALVAIVTAVGLGSLYYYLTLSIVPIGSASEMIGPWYVASSFGLTFVTAILAGISISLLIFKLKGSMLSGIKGSGSSMSLGTVLAGFTPGCPACTTPLIAILTTIGGLALFPLQGLELKLVSIAALSFSIYWLLKSMQHLYEPHRRRA